MGSGNASLNATATNASQANNNAYNNYNSYVLFPSDSFDLSPQQLEEQQQLQQQNSNYYPIEDVLANLIR